MSRCKLILNKKSGGSKKIDIEAEIKVLREIYDEVELFVVKEDEEGEATVYGDEGFDAVAVCGGDGTLNVALNSLKNKDTKFIYIPCGTLNDKAKSLELAKRLRGERRIRQIDVGKVNDKMFAYVCAGGTFTPIGYSVNGKLKKRFKVFAYILTVLKEYKIYRMKGKIKSETVEKEGEFSLIMAINSERCFGFRFNKMYKHNDGKGQMLLIKSPKNSGLLGKIALFFPMFRAFFIGFKKEYHSKNMDFFTFNKCTMSLEKEADFTVDGDKITLGGENEISILQKKLNLVVFK